MPFSLRSGLHYRFIDADCIFFDLAADRYFLLSGTAAACFGRFVSGRSGVSDRERLLSQGLIVPGVPRDCDDPIVPATASLMDRALPNVSRLAAISTIWEQMRARRDLRRRSLATIVLGMRQNACSHSAGGGTGVEVAAAFQRARRYAPATDQCLVTALAMKRMLLRRGTPATLIFGVAMPFAAHCWVQSEETVLSDPLDIVLHYQPIFAI